MKLYILTFKYDLSYNNEWCIDTKKFEVFEYG